MQPQNTGLYVPSGRGIVYIGEWTGSTPPALPTAFVAGSLGGYEDVGNATAFEVEPSVEFNPHYTKRQGINEKDFNPYLPKNTRQPLLWIKWGQRTLPGMSWVLTMLQLALLLVCRAMIRSTVLFL